MNSRIKNKRGTEKVVSVYWFAIIVIISGGVFAMAYSFYSTPYDIREIEGGILADKIADCISNQGRLNSNLFIDEEFNTNFSDDFSNLCKFNLKTENEYSWSETPQYFIEVSFYNVTNTENHIFIIQEGNLNYRGDCFIENESGKDYSRLVKCNEERLYALDYNGKQYLIKILVAVNKAEKNVKL